MEEEEQWLPITFPAGKFSKSGAAASWEQITETRWYDIDYEKAHNNLYAAAYRLRKWLAEQGISDLLEK